MQMFFSALFCIRKPQRKVTKLKSKFYLILGHLNRALKNPAKELRILITLTRNIQCEKFTEDRYVSQPSD